MILVNERGGNFSNLKLGIECLPDHFRDPLKQLAVDGLTTVQNVINFSAELLLWRKYKKTIDNQA